MSDPNLILKDTGSVEQTNRLVCMYAETVFQDEQTLRLIESKKARKGADDAMQRKEI